MSAALQCCPHQLNLQCLSGPAGGVEEIRQQRTISYPLGPKAEKGLISSPADPEGLKPQGYLLAVFSNSFYSAIQPLFSCPLTLPHPFLAVPGGCPLFSASGLVSGRPIFLCMLATLQEAEEGPIKVTFSLPQRAESLYEERKLIL